MLGITPEMLLAQESEKIQYAPRLVVSITIDQLRTDYVQAFSPLYGNSGFKRLLRQGLVFPNAAYPFTPTDRASAVATLITGVTPYYHSIVGERWLNRETLRPDNCTGDDATPANIATSTLGDELKVATKGMAVVYGIAPTVDAAILSAGHAADGALWIDDATGLWTYSKYFATNAPAWLSTFNELRSPATNLKNTQWEPVIELSGKFNYYQHVDNDKPFKHKFQGNERFEQLKASGLVNGYVTEMAQQCVSQASMGFDRVTDLLSVTYYAGTYGHKAASECIIELQDTYTRLDRELSSLMSGIERKVGAEHVLFVVTSTGYSDPESADYEHYRIPSGTFYINRTANLLNMYFGAIWGQGRWVEACFQNQMFLNHKLLESKRISLADATQRAQEFLAQVSGVRNIYTSQQLISNLSPQTLKVRNGYNASRCGDILIEVSPGWKLFNEDNQDTQLSRASFTQFPIVFLGAGIAAGTVSDRVTVDHIAPTIAKSIRIRAPNACSAEPLF